MAASEREPQIDVPAASPPDASVPDASVPDASVDGATATPDVPAPIIDWSRTARRLRAILLVIGTTAVVAWLVVGFLGDGPTLPLLAELFGIGLLVTFAVEVIVVGGVAIRGMLAAGERGDRLASQDVFLLPPQLLRGHRRDEGPGQG